MTLEQLLRILPYARPYASRHLNWLNRTMAEFDINTPGRRASFISQLGHESGSLRYVQELASGAAYDTGRLAAQLGNTPEPDGDGQKWKGHGLFQITGAFNHLRCAAYFGVDPDDIVRWLMTPEGACRSAGWFWKTHGLNELADAGDQLAITRRVNGGVNGLSERLALFENAVKAFA